MKKEPFKELLLSVKEAVAIEHSKIKPLRTFDVKPGLKKLHRKFRK